MSLIVGGVIVEGCGLKQKNSKLLLVGGLHDDRVTVMAFFMYGNWTENGKLEVKLTKNRRKIDFEPKSVRRRADFGLFW